MLRILLLDTDRRSTLSIARALSARPDSMLYGAGSGRFDLCRFSNSIRKHFLYTDPRENLTEFLATLTRVVEELQPDLVLPCSDITATALLTSELYAENPGLFALPEPEQYFTASDKRRCAEIARRVGVAVPGELSLEQIQPDCYPVVVKPRFSWYVRGNRMTRADRVICKTPEQLQAALKKLAPIDENPLIQEFVPGRGYGQFFAARNGEIIAEFAHERIREIPPTGGYSSLRKSVRLNPEMRAASEKLIRELGYSGIAMVEYRGTIGGNFWLMEVNARPWGSLDLAVCSGVDFPSLMLEIFSGRLSVDDLRDKFAGHFKEGHYSKWLIGEMKYVAHILKSPKSLRWKINKAKEVMHFVPGKTSFDTFRRSDPLPLFAELIAVVSKWTSLLQKRSPFARRAWKWQTRNQG